MRVEKDARTGLGRLRTTLRIRAPPRHAQEKCERRQDAEGWVHQNVSLMAICIVRGSLARAVIVPSVAGLARSRFGRPKFTVLNRLKMSHRRTTPAPEARRI